jgi:hypothetical protein
MVVEAFKKALKIRFKLGQQPFFFLQFVDYLHFL